MIGGNFKYRGQNISIITDDFRIWLDVVGWKSLNVSDSQSNIQWFHWVKLSPTYARSRTITIEWVILADNHEGLSKWIEYLDNLFSLEWIPTTVWLYPFLVTDEQSREREIQAKIKEALSIDVWDDDYLPGATRKFRVVLQSEDPRYYNTILKQETWIEGIYGGTPLWVELWVSLDWYFNEMEVISAGNSETPLKLTITTIWEINSPLTIKNLTTWKYFWLDITATVDDIIIIDSSNLTATKNGINILANRVSGSTRPRIKGTNDLSVYDVDWGMSVSDFTIEIEYRDVLL